mgnify:CR=1 FL=1
MSYGRFTILLALLETINTTITNVDLSLKLGIGKATVKKMLDKLFDEKLIESSIDAIDSRKRKLVITKIGKTKLESIIPGYLERMRIIGANISIDEKRFLIGVLNKINFLDTKRKISQFNERPLSEISNEIKELCDIGSSENIDQVMAYLNEVTDIPTTKIIDFYLGTVTNIDGMKQIEYYLYNGTQIQRNYCALFFVRINDWKIVNKAYKLGLIDYIQAYSK